MNSRNYSLKCQWCGEPFMGLRPTDKYHTPSCRYKATAAAHTEKQKQRRQEYQKKWGQENWLHKRNYMIKYTYGISPEQYQELLERQDYRCFICQRHETEFSKKLAVDHNHQTGEIYGLLCHTCNKDLIGKHRDPVVFERAELYLQSCRTGWYVPEKKKRPTAARRRRRSSI